RVACEAAALDAEVRVRVGEDPQALRRLDDVAGYEGQCGGASEQIVKPVHTRVDRGALREGVLRDGVLRLRAERAAQLLELAHGEPAILGEHRGRRGSEVLGQLGNRGGLVASNRLLRHVPPLVASGWSTSPGVEYS